MTIPYDEKVTLLQKFHTFLDDPSWNYTKSTDKDRIVLENFTTVSKMCGLAISFCTRVYAEILSQRVKYFRGAKFEIQGTGANNGFAENKNGIAKSVSILQCFKFLKVILIGIHSISLVS